MLRILTYMTNLQVIIYLLIALFSWQIGDNTIINLTSTSLVTEAQNSAADAGLDAQICQDSYILQGNGPDAGLTASWSLVSGSGDIADVNDPNTLVSNLGFGANVFQWTFFDNGNPVSSAQVTITRDEAPTTANAGSNQSVCATSATLAANTPTVGNGLWSVVSGSGTFADATDPNTTVSDLGVGANIFRWTISNGSCTPSTSDVTITRDEAPTTANAGSNQSVCATSAT
ncbi:MAG: hypothetical protein ACK4GL_06775, partial [Flavobacteriales bacterium]